MAGEVKRTAGAAASPGGGSRCVVEGCERPLFAQGRCGFHALLGYYRTVAEPGGGLSAVRVARPPRLLGDADPESAGKRASGPRSTHGR
jgi:hypothetical protein